VKIKYFIFQRKNPSFLSRDNLIQEEEEENLYPQWIYIQSGGISSQFQSLPETRLAANELLLTLW
jgi:hypothetical protein